MTPRQLFAYSMLAERRISIEKASDLNLNAMAARAEDKIIKEATRSLLKER